MNTLKTFALFLLSILLLSSCVSNSDDSNKSNVNNKIDGFFGKHQDEGQPLTTSSTFDEIEVFNNVEVIFTPAHKIAFSVQASETAKKRLKMRVVGETLNIYVDSLRTREKIVVTLSAPMVEGITAYNNASFTCSSPVNVKELSVGAYNNGSVTLSGAVSVPELDFKAYNNGTIKINSLNSEDIDADAFNNATLLLSAVSAKSIEVEAFNNATVNLEGKTGTISVNKYNGATVNTTALQSSN